MKRYVRAAEDYKTKSLKPKIDEFLRGTVLDFYDRSMGDQNDYFQKVFNNKEVKDAASMLRVALESAIDRQMHKEEE